MSIRDDGKGIDPIIMKKGRSTYYGLAGMPERAWLIVRDEFRPAIPRSGCSPAGPVSALPATRA